MNKKLLLIALPALMTLSACSGAFGPQKAANLMEEDTLAHEEVFGEAAEARDLRMAPRRAVDFDADFVKVGYQIKFEENGEGTADDKISIRFVAAIKDLGVEAYWHRGFAQPNSSEGAEVDPVGHPGVWKYKLNDGVVNQSTKYYTTLNDGGSAITANTGDYVGYQGFIIYTLLHIPYEQYKDSYLGAYVDLVDPDNNENNQKSKFLAIKVEKEDAYHSKNAFSVPNTYLGKHFLQGTINGSEQTVLEDESVLDGDHNFASYKDVVLKNTDSFGSYYLSTEHFQFFGHAGFFSESSAIFDESASLAGYNTPKADGTYSLLLSKGSGTENHVYTAQDAASHLFTITVPNWLGNDDCVIFAQIERSNHEWIFVDVAYTKDTTTATFTAPENIVQFEMFRCVAGTTKDTINWDLHDPSNDPGRIYNRSGKQTVTEGTYEYTRDSWSNY